MAESKTLAGSGLDLAWLAPLRRPKAKAGLVAPQRLGLHQVAYLRSLAEGLDAKDTAKRYLGINHGAQLKRAHHQTLDLVRAVARRSGDSRWRLLGLDIPVLDQATPAGAGAGQGGQAGVGQLPTVEDWALAEGLDGMTFADQLEAYQEHFAEQLAAAKQASDPVGDAGHSTSQASGAARRAARNARLRKARVALLHHLERTAVEIASRQDRLDGWFAPELVDKLRAVGALTLGDLQARIARGGRWWRGLKGIGEERAKPIAAHLQQLLAHAPVPLASAGAAGVASGSALACQVLREIQPEGSAQALGVHGRNRVHYADYRVVRADNDAEAIEAWIKARCKSEHSRVSYRRELTRLRLWLWHTHRRAMSDATVEDCEGYMAFLAAVPEAWMSLSNVTRGEAGWTPFRKQPTVASQQLALNIIHGAFAWLAQHGYLQLNPWGALNRKLGDADPDAEEDAGLAEEDDDPTSRAFTPEAWQALVDQAEAEASAERPRKGAERLRWLLQFAEATGLRADELLRARRRSLFCKDGIWRLRVFGKGRRRRRVPVPKRVIELTRAYFRSRGLDFDHCGPKVHLLGAIEGSRVTKDEPKAPEEGVGYGALAQAFKGLLQRASVRLPLDQARRMQQGSLHWLRHTHGTRSAERGLNEVDIQTNLGHADTRTTALYTSALMRRRAALIEKAFG